MIFDKRRRYAKVYTPYYDNLADWDDPEAWLKSYHSVPKKPRNLFCVHWTHLEVFNGGFWQFFFNSTGVMAPEAVVAFKAIGMSDVAAVIERAMSKLGPAFPRLKAGREQLVGEVDKQKIDFDEEDDAFYALADTDKIFFRNPRFVEFADAYAFETP